MLPSPKCPLSIRSWGRSIKLAGTEEYSTNYVEHLESGSSVQIVSVSVSHAICKSGIPFLHLKNTTYGGDHPDKPYCPV